MPRIWDEDYLKNHTKTQLNALLKSYEDARWQCPRCDEVNFAWSRDRIVRGWVADWGTEFTLNNYCGECNFIRKNGKEFNLNGKKPRKQRVKSMPDRKADLRHLKGKQLSYDDKRWTIELHNKEKVVRVYWGKVRNESGGFKEFNFKNLAEAQEFYDKKINEKLRKGYRDEFQDSEFSDGTRLTIRKAARRTAAKGKKSARRPKARAGSTKKAATKKSTKKAPAKSRAKKKSTKRKARESFFALNTPGVKWIS